MILKYIKYITLRVPCTSQAGCLSPSSMCFGSSECANSLIGIMSWCADDGQPQWVACVQSVLCEGCYIAILQGSSVLCQSMSEGLARVSSVLYS